MRLAHTARCRKLRAYLAIRPTMMNCDGQGYCGFCNGPAGCKNIKASAREAHQECLKNLLQRQQKAAHEYPGDGKGAAAGPDRD